MQSESFETESTKQKPNTFGLDSIGRDFLILSLFCAIVMTIYSQTLGAPFVLDDGTNILENRHIRITDLTFESLYDAAFNSPRSKRPAANISFALNYYFGQYNVLGYHLVNMMIHIASGMALYFFLKTTFLICAPSLLQVRMVPFFASLIWLVHPVQTQSVTYIVQRMAGMSALFYLVTMLFYVRARMLHREAQSIKMMRGLFRVYFYYIGAFFAGIIALSSKENAVTLPFFLILYEWFFFRNLDIEWLKKNGSRFFGVFILFFILFLMLVFIYAGANPVEKILSLYHSRDFSLTQRLMTESRVVIFYISLLAFPHPSRLNLEHDFLLSHSLFNPVTTFLSIGCIAVLFFGAIRFVRKDRFLSFCILWFLGNLALESTFIGLEIIFEHRLYLPSMFAATIPVYVCFRYIKPEYMVRLIMCLLIVLFSIWTYKRNSVWKDKVTLFTDCVQKSPNKERPRLSLGNALIQAGRNDQAIIILSKMIQLHPNSAFAHNSYGVALAIAGDIEQAIPHFEEAIRILPIYEEAKHNLDKALAYQKEDKRIDRR